MGETVNVLFQTCEDGTYSILVKESWSGRTVSGSFVPPYVGRQLNALQKRLGNLESRDHELREVGYHLFSALCGFDTTGPKWSEPTDLSVQGVFRNVIQRTLKRRGTVALMLSFGPGCDEFVRYPWELLHNGDHFLLVSGVFTLSRLLLGPDGTVGCELPVRPPFRILYVAPSPTNGMPLETERSFEAMQQALAPLIDGGQIVLDRLEPPTFSQLVRYLNSYGGTGMLDDSDTAIPCYAIHFDGHGAYGRLCPQEECETVNDPEARKCHQCGASLSRINPQTYLSFCDDEGLNCFIDTQSLRELLLSSDVRLAVFAACETATVSKNPTRSLPHSANRPAVKATLAIALVTAQVPAVVAMPFSLQDDLSPTFMFHFYEALADGRTLEEALSRARQALLPMQHKSWFIPVLYRHVAEGEETPVPLMTVDDVDEDHTHPLAYLGPPIAFVGRKQELQDFDELLTTAASGQQKSGFPDHLRSGAHLVHHIALTGPPGIGKSALAFEVVRRNRDKFPGGIIGVSLQNGKLFVDALAEMIHLLHLPLHNLAAMDTSQRTRQVQGALRSLASRELNCLLLLDGFEEVQDRTELGMWLQFLSALPQEVVVIVTSHVNPLQYPLTDRWNEKSLTPLPTPPNVENPNRTVPNMSRSFALGGPHCHWYEYHLGKMTYSDLLTLFTVLAEESGLDKHIHLHDPMQQAMLREICALLDGYPLGAELVFGTARSVDGKVYMPEATTRSLEEVRDELRSTPLAGMQAILEISYRRLTHLACLLLAYLSAFKLPFNREQIMMLVNSVPFAAVQEAISVFGEQEAIPEALLKDWRAGRDELVQASFIQFDGHVYTIHSQVRHFALARLPLEEQRRVHRLIAAHYRSLPQPHAEEIFAAFEHLEAAGETQDLQEAIQIAEHAAQKLDGHGQDQEWQAILRRAELYAARLSQEPQTQSS